MIALVVVAAIGAAWIAASLVDRGGRPEYHERPVRPEVIARLVPTVPGDMMLGGWASAESLEQLVRDSDFVGLVRVVADLEPEVRSGGATVLGTQAFGHRVIAADVLDVAEGNAASLRAAGVDGRPTVLLSARWSNGSLVSMDVNPELLIGETYLVFTKASPANGLPAIVYPFTQHEINGRLYLAGISARPVPGQETLVVDAEDPGSDSGTRRQDGRSKSSGATPGRSAQRSLVL